MRGSIDLDDYGIEIFYRHSIYHWCTELILSNKLFTVINNSLRNVNDHTFIGNYYGCTYYYINEDPYIYEIHDNEREGEKRPLEFSLCSFSFFLPFFILYNTLTT